MTYQTVVWVEEPGPAARLHLRTDQQVPKPLSDEVLVRMEVSGVCHSDVYNVLGVHPMTTKVPGHEGIGRIAKLGSEVSTLSLGQRVGVKWLYRNCQQCAICEREPTACPTQQNSGRDVPGTLQQYLAVPAHCLTPIPDGIRSADAAPLLCAGLTMYSAIKKTKPQVGDWLVLYGAGGGLGHLGLQIAVDRKMRVIAIDSGEEKRKACLEHGAAAFLDFKTADITREVLDLTESYGAHAVICATGSPSSYSAALGLLRRTGTLVCVGLPSPEYAFAVSPMDMVVRGATIIGSSVGTEDEMQELLKLAANGVVRPEVQMFEIEQVQEVFEMLRNGTILGRAVIRIP